MIFISTILLFTVPCNWVDPSSEDNPRNPIGFVSGKEGHLGEKC